VLKDWAPGGGGNFIYLSYHTIEKKRWTDTDPDTFFIKFMTLISMVFVAGIDFYGYISMLDMFAKKRISKTWETPRGATRVNGNVIYLAAAS